jgi:hypothetical protein
MEQDNMGHFAVFLHLWMKEFAVFNYVLSIHILYNAL